MSHFVDDEARGTDEACQRRRFFSGPTCERKFVPQLRGLDEVRLQSLLTALEAKRLRQMRFSCSGGTNEGNVPMRVDRSQRSEVSQVFQIFALQN